ncbi:type II toxin-antitoxin system VapC family toxin [Asticcacaulis sp. W401b]|uniref:type II toxin-antitoxin system VapC family toxin n=1 Tax=Asticcacaulis sp. W401b TaxID=3388666 RepID=UPI003970FCF5
MQHYHSDTNVVSELMRPGPHEHVRDWLRRSGDVGLTTTAITVAEITHGLERLPDGRRKSDLQAAFVKLLDALGALPLDDAAGFKAGKFRALREAVGHPSSPSDMVIAGIAVALGASLATRNTKDFEALPLALIDPWAAH